LLDKEHLVCKLKQVLYSLKKVQNIGTKWLIHLWLHIITRDPYMIDASTLCLLTNHLYTFKAHLDSEFEINDLCAAKKLGFEITEKKNSDLLFLSQHSYINKKIIILICLMQTLSLHLLHHT
jgi:hypothetical protein